MPTGHDPDAGALLSAMKKWDWFTPVMHALDPLRARQMRRTLATIAEHYPLADSTRTLDVGSGTGTLLRALHPYGCRMKAVEPSSRMFHYSRRRFPTVALFQEPAHAMSSIPDKSIDIAFVSATLHGFDPAYRQRVYRELHRVTRDTVAVIDYHENTSFVVSAVEWLEGGDYFRFVRNAKRELEAAFSGVTAVRVSSIESVYFCDVEQR